LQRPLGRIVAAPRTLAAFESSGDAPLDSLLRHVIDRNVQKLQRTKGLVPGGGVYFSLHQFCQCYGNFLAQSMTYVVAFALIRAILSLYSP
jgi:hypothetical protein